MANYSDVPFITKVGFAMLNIAVWETLKWVLRKVSGKQITEAEKQSRKPCEHDWIYTKYTKDDSCWLGHVAARACSKCLISQKGACKPNKDTQMVSIDSVEWLDADGFDRAKELANAVMQPNRKRNPPQPQPDYDVEATDQLLNTLEAEEHEKH